jgi:hypothetical protein
MNLLSPSFKFKGNFKTAIDLKSYSLKQYNLLASKAEREGLSSLSRTTILQDGSLIVLNVFKQSIYNNWAGTISIVSPISTDSKLEEEVFIFAFISTENSSKRLSSSFNFKESDRKSLTFRREFPPSSIVGVQNNGIFSNYTKRNSINLVILRYSDAAEYISTIGSIQGMFGYINITLPWTNGLALDISGQKYNLKDIIPGLASTVDIFGSSRISVGRFLSLQAVEKEGASKPQLLLVAGGGSTLENIYTTLTDASYPKIAPGRVFRHLTLLDRVLRISPIYPIDPLPDRTLGTISPIIEYVVTRPSGYNLLTRFIYVYAELTKKALNNFFNIGTNDPSKAYLVTVTVDNDNINHYHRKLVIRKQLFSSSGATTVPIIIESFDLTESDFTYFILAGLSGSITPFHNRVKKSIISVYEIIQDSLGDEYFCYISKSSTYTLASVNSNSITEVVEVNKINIDTGVKTTSTLDTTTFTENIVGPSAEFPVGNTHILQTYYCDYINNIYVYGKINVHTSVVVNFGMIPYQIILDNNGVKSVIKEITFPIGLITVKTNPPSNPTFPNEYGAWSLWDSLRDQNPLNPTGIIVNEKSYQKYKEDSGTIKGVFTVRTPARIYLEPPTLPETKFYIETSGLNVKITELETVNTIFHEKPFITID